ncbi:hypothetical protein Tco_0910593 [Tanacetum coccineum]|uniref:Uncharacterized protein n=1 Tax=Tanacetum coccineum TaxID=301880 RepID=A0ABQ5CVJ7_9ASTR
MVSDRRGTTLFPTGSSMRRQKLDVEVAKTSHEVLQSLGRTYCRKNQQAYERSNSKNGNDTVKKDREIFENVVPELVLKEFATYAPKIIEELFKRHMKNKVLNVHPTISISTAKTTAGLKQQLYLKMKTYLQAQPADPEMWDANDGPHEGEKWAKSQETSKGYYIDKGSSLKCLHNMSRYDEKNIIILDSVDKRVVSLGNRDVFCEKVMDDDFGESGTGHLLLYFGTGLPAINLELEIFPYTSE